MTSHTVLIPLDGSELAERALGFAETIARVTGCSLTLVSVLRPEDTGPLGLSPDDRRRVHRRASSALRSYLETVAGPLRAHGMTVSCKVLTGNAAHRILSYARTLHADAIVMSTHGRGGLKRLFLGSVADKVIRQADRPVLISGKLRRLGGRTGIKLERLLVPLDGSSMAEAALAPAMALAEAAGASLTLVRVEPWRLTALAPGYEIPPTPPEFDESMEQEAASYLAGIRDRIAAKVRTNTFFFRGEPNAQIISCAEREDADLIVMSSHGRGGLTRAVLGSTADRVIRSGLPVLLVPATSRRRRKTAPAASAVRPN
jgi:nucleotide-binding universal stress UspA family protein